MGKSFAFSLFQHLDLVVSKIGNLDGNGLGEDNIL